VLEVLDLVGIYLLLAESSSQENPQGNCFFCYLVHSAVPFKNSDACGGHRLRRAAVIFAQTRSRTGLMYLLFSSSFFLFSSFSPSLPLYLLFLLFPLFAFSLPPGFSLTPVSVQSPPKFPERQHEKRLPA
jgi:hypothetical protein